MDARTETPSVEIDPWVDRIGGWIERHRGLSIRLGNLESRLWADRMRDIDIARPIYVAGIARSGSTILLELLSRHPDLATHRYRDFPALFTPVFWNWFVDRAGSAPQEAKERAHKDRIRVTPESPEAFEEVIWTGFFPKLHTSDGNAVLDADSDNPAFEAFYRDHMRKIIALRGGSRYLAKANYNVTRLGYLLKLFPEARFIVPMRDPVWHVASLMKQHDLFCREGMRDARVTHHLERSGHFEFGLSRRAPVIGNGAAEVERLWREGDDVAGWAMLWALVYGHLAAALDADAALRAATKIVRYEDLCADPSTSMAAVLEHCGLAPEGIPERASAEISPPGYYRPGFTDEEVAIIRDRTSAVASAFGYSSAPGMQES